VPPHPPIIVLVVSVGLRLICIGRLCLDSYSIFMFLHQGIQVQSRQRLRSLLSLLRKSAKNLMLMAGAELSICSVVGCIWLSSKVCDAPQVNSLAGFKSSLKNRVYSSAYRKHFNKLKNQGVPQDLCGRSLLCAYSIVVLVCLTGNIIHYIIGSVLQPLPG